MNFFCITHTQNPNMFYKRPKKKTPLINKNALMRSIPVIDG